MKSLTVLIVASMALALVSAQSPSPAPDAIESRLEALTSIQTLNATLLASRSATATLESWCREHRLAETPRIVAHLVAGARRKPSSEQLRRLEVASDREVSYRRVRLQCGTHVLSEAENWYVRDRLTAEMNRLLDTTDTPFGRAVAPLQPYRRTFAVRMLWADTSRPIPDTLLEHHAVLYTRDNRPFSEVSEVYRRDLLGDSAAGPADAARAIRAARLAQNDAIAAGDLDRAAAFWTDDVTVRRALGQPLSGRTAARQALEPSAPPAPRLVYQRVTADVDISSQWPLAFESGTWEGHLETPTGPTVIGGRFSAQWVKRGDRWLIRSEVFVALTCSGIGCQSAAVP
ncbi:MAG TPA: nuclear transport factor 2 family protein [Vicinamibacterales bacterium]|nr:nuclear transport factor 2 family protein [Vicinamibacterales bacterium]